MSKKTDMYDVLRSIPNIGRVSGEPLQNAFRSLNQQFVNTLRTAALMEPVEPLASSLIGLPWDVIRMFNDPLAVNRIVDQSYGFPLVQARITDPRVYAQLLDPTSTEEATIRAVTASMPYEVVARATGGGTAK